MSAEGQSARGPMLKKPAMLAVFVGESWHKGCWSLFVSGRAAGGPARGTLGQEDAKNDVREPIG
jgi:hypothetical protein